MSQIQSIGVDCQDLNLMASLQQAVRIGTLGVSNSEQLSSMIRDFRLRIQDELKSRVLFIVDSGKEDYFRNPFNKFGTFAGKFSPSPVFDIEEAGKCMALARYTASVFHLQRVLEIGLKALAVKLGKPFDRNSWESHLRDIERELEARYKAAGSRTPDEEFYSEAASQIGHMKVAWRNPTMHIDRSYPPEIAVDIWNAVSAFMRHLSTKLP
jgi:hypothetical protein